jgi:hypothetical protein
MAVKILFLTIIAKLSDASEGYKTVESHKGAQTNRGAKRVHSAALRADQKQGRKLERSSQGGFVSYRFLKVLRYHPRRTKSLKSSL